MSEGHACRLMQLEHDRHIAIGREKQNGIANCGCQ